MLRHILYLVYLDPSLGLGLFMSNLCDLFFIFSLILIAIIHTDALVFLYLSEYPLLSLDENVEEKVNSFRIAKVQSP